VSLLKKGLYLGLDLPDHLKEDFLHHPLIEIIPLSYPPVDVDPFTHIVFTSKTCVRLFCAENRLAENRLAGKKLVAVGQMTAKALEKIGYPVDHIAEEETSEGVVALLKKLPLEDSNILWPHSLKSRSVITDFLESNNIRHTELPIYDTVTKRGVEKVDLCDYNALFFSSPSTVDAFLEIYGPIPENMKILSQGSITRDYIEH
jgi:uroporphyrinogen-III synthase